MQVVLIAVEDWVTKVRESHLEVRLHVIVSLVHVEAEELLGESFETLSIQPTGSCLCSFAPLLDLLQRVVEFHCRLVACQSWCGARQAFVSRFIQVELQVPSALTQSFVGIKEVYDSACDWLVNIICLHAVDLDSESGHD